MVLSCGRLVSQRQYDPKDERFFSFFLLLKKYWMNCGGDY